MLRSLLVEVGDSPHAQAAMDTALTLAKTFGARLRALACLDERSVPSEHIRLTVEEHTRDWLAAFERRCRDAEIACDSDLEVGEPRAALVHLARKADLLVIGSAPDPDAQARGYASAPSAIAREVVRPVLVVRETPVTFRSIVVGYAGRENSCNALQLSAHLAEKFGATLHLVTSDRDVARAGAVMNVGLEYLSTFDVEVVPHQSSGEAADVLLGTITETEADLVAMGAIRRSKLHMLAFGDTASRILDWSPAAVLVCR